MIKVTTTTNSEYQEFKTWQEFEKTSLILHSYDDKPSYISYYGSGKVSYKEWYLNGRLHRTNNKPGYIRYYNGDTVKHKHWYIDGIRYSNQDYKQIIKQVKSMSDTEKLLDSRQWVREMVTCK